MFLGTASSHTITEPSNRSGNSRSRSGGVSSSIGGSSGRGVEEEDAKWATSDAGVPKLYADCMGVGGSLRELHGLAPALVAVTVQIVDTGCPSRQLASLGASTLDLARGEHGLSWSSKGVPLSPHKRWAVSDWWMAGALDADALGEAVSEFSVELEDWMDTLAPGSAVQFLTSGGPAQRDHLNCLLRRFGGGGALAAPIDSDGGDLRHKPPRSVGGLAASFPGIPVGLSSSPATTEGPTAFPASPTPTPPLVPLSPARPVSVAVAAMRKNIADSNLPPPVGWATAAASARRLAEEFMERLLIVARESAAEPSATTQSATKS